MTLERFETALEKGDLSVLTKEGNPTEEDLANHWNQIQADYCDLTGDDGFKELMRLRSVNMALTLKIEHVQLLCYYLKRRYYPEYIETLKAYGYNEGDRYTFDINDPQVYIRDLDRVLASLGNDEQKIEDNDAEINSYIESKKVRKIQSGYFDETLVEIERGLQLHFGLDKSVLTIGKYATYINKLRKQHTPK